MSVLRFAAAGLLAVLVSTGASADWREDYPVLRVGILAERNPVYRVAQAEPFRKYLAERLGAEVELIPAATWSALIDAQVHGSLPLAFLSASAYAAAEAQCDCVRPVAVPTAADGTPGFHAVLVAPVDSPIADLAGLSGRKLAVSGEDSIAGRMLPLRLFAAEGIAESDLTLVPAAGPREAILSMFSGEADAALAWSSLAGDPAAGYSRGVLTEMVAGGTLGMDEIRIVWQSPMIPYGPLSASTELPEELVTLIRDALIDMAASDPAALDAIDRSGGGGFTAANAAMFDPLAVLVEADPG
jgi:phosphonate transport system substrate-binding protein